MWTPMTTGHWFMSSVWNFCRWVADVPRETSQRRTVRRNRRLLRFYLPLCTFQPTFLLLFIGRQCPDEEEMRELVEEFYQDFFRLYMRLRKKARVIIKFKKKYAEGKLKYLPNDKENARMWWIARGWTQCALKLHLRLSRETKERSTRPWGKCTYYRKKGVRFGLFFIRLCVCFLYVRLTTLED